MSKVNPCSLRHVLLTLGLGLGLLVAAPSGCLGLTVSNTSFSIQNYWRLSLPSVPSLMNPGAILQQEPELTGVFLLNGEGEWLFDNGGRFFIADTVRLRLDRNGPELNNRLNELYFSMNPLDDCFVDLGKQVLCAGTGYFLSPAGLWPEQSTFMQDRGAPPEGKVLIRGEYLFPRLTMQVGWAPQLKWAENGDGFLWRYIGSPQQTALTWAMVSGGFAGLDLCGLISYRGQWRTGLSLARVWGDRLETHCEMGWEEWEENHVKQLNELFYALLEEETGAVPPPLMATAERGSLKALLGGHYTFAGGGNLIVEYFFNGSGLTQKEWGKVLQYMTANSRLALEVQNYPLVGARLQKATAFLAEAGFPGLLRHYAMARFCNELLPALALEQIVIQNLVDESGLAIFLLSYERDLFSLSFGVQLPYGKRESEFGLLAEQKQVKIQTNVGF